MHLGQIILAQAPLQLSLSEQQKELRLQPKPFGFWCSWVSISRASFKFLLGRRVETIQPCWHCFICWILAGEEGAVVKRITFKKVTPLLCCQGGVRAGVQKLLKHTVLLKQTVLNWSAKIKSKALVWPEACSSVGSLEEQAPLSVSGAPNILL